MLRVALMGALSLGLVAILPVVVVAQGEEAAPTGFSGRIHPSAFEDCFLGRLEIVGGVEQLRDGRCEDRLESSDPRFTGTYITWANSDGYRDARGDLEGGTLAVRTVVRRVENDGGAWEAPANVEAWWLPEPDDEDEVVQTDGTMPIETLVFTGEGGYEGLTAVIWLNPFFVNARFQGVIFEGTPPPVPPAE